jgi:hypothetical protein
MLSLLRQDGNIVNRLAVKSENPQLEALFVT